MKRIEKIDIFNFDLENGKNKAYLSLQYEVFGEPLGSSPVIVINHSLTSNSSVSGVNGWWKEIVKDHGPVDTSIYTIIAFNIPGNGYGGKDSTIIENYKDFTIRDIARIFWEGLSYLKISNLHALIGVSLGGAIAWEMAALQPKKIEHLIPIATDWKATDWVIANVLIQDQILNNSDNPIVDARLHATLLYRTPEYLNQSFKREKQESSSLHQIEEWLFENGNQLKRSYQLNAYKLMNHLLKTNDITRNRNSFQSVSSSIKSTIHLIAIDSDYLFIANETRKTYRDLKSIKQNVYYNQVQSIHGHDAFLLEFNQIRNILAPILHYHKQHNYVSA